jgi:hypothetical protein
VLGLNSFHQFGIGWNPVGAGKNVNFPHCNACPHVPMGMVYIIDTFPKHDRRFIDTKDKNAAKTYFVREKPCEVSRTACRRP